MLLVGTKQSHNIDSKYVEIASRFVPRARNDEKLLFGADSTVAIAKKLYRSQIVNYLRSIGFSEFSIYCFNFYHIIPIVFQKFELFLKNPEIFDAKEFIKMPKNYIGIKAKWTEKYSNPFYLLENCFLYHASFTPKIGIGLLSSLSFNTA